MSLIDRRTVTGADVDGTTLEVEATFCCLGDMLCSVGGCDSAIVARCCVVWGKFRKLLPVLSSRHLSPSIRGKVYGACIRSAMLHGSETWGPKEIKLRQLHRDDRAVIHWIYGIKDRNETPSDSLLQKHYVGTSLSATQMVWPCTTGHILYQNYHKLSDPRH